MSAPHDFAMAPLAESVAPPQRFSKSRHPAPVPGEAIATKPGAHGQLSRYFCGSYKSSRDKRRSLFLF